MRNFDWLFDENNKVREGLKCVYNEPFHEFYFSGSLDYNEPKIARLSGYYPYYTDGTPDPQPDEVNEWNYIEVDGEDVHESQASLEHLFPIDYFEIPEQVYYNDDVYEYLGTANDEEFHILGLDGKLYVTDDKNDIQEMRDITELTKDELKLLRRKICAGSMYLSDYQNPFGIPTNKMMDYSDMYLKYLEYKYGYEWDNYDTEEEFANLEWL